MRSAPRCRRAGRRCGARGLSWSAASTAVHRRHGRGQPARPEDLPQYWLDAADALDAQPHDTRVLEVPGIDFASYRWGNTVDPITPGLMDRPYVARELIPYGSPRIGRSAQRLRSAAPGEHARTARPSPRSPGSSALGDVVARNDLQFERFHVGAAVRGDAAPSLGPGLEPAATFGPPTVNVPSPIAPMQDEAALRDDTATPYPPVVIFTVGRPTTDHPRRGRAGPGTCRRRRRGSPGTDVGRVARRVGARAVLGLLRRRWRGAQPTDRARGGADRDGLQPSTRPAVEHPARQPRLHRAGR